MPSLVSFTRPSPQILGKSFFAISGIPFKTLVNKNCHNLRYNSEIDVKLWPVYKIVKGNPTASTKIWQWHPAGKLRCHFHFPDFCPICRNPKPGFQTNGIWFINFNEYSAQPSCHWLKKMYIFGLKRRNCWFSCK